MTDNSVDSATSASSKRGEGLPVWMPIVGLLIAFVFAIFVGARICPTLSGVVLPPDPPLPSGTISMLTHEGKGVGLDEYLYGTDLHGCQIAQYYQQRFGACIYDPDSNCNKGGVPPIQAGVAAFIAQCTGADTIGAFRVTWTVYISTGYAEQGRTHFRVIREMGN